MSIKQIYSEVEKSKVDSGPSMTKKEFVTEHKRLIKVLNSGDKKALADEAKLQQEELDEFLGTKEEQGEPTDADDME